MVSKCNDKCPYKKDAETDLRQKRSRPWNGIRAIERKCCAAGFEDRERDHKLRNAALDAEKGKRNTFSPRVFGGNITVNILILAPYNAFLTLASRTVRE